MTKSYLQILNPDISASERDLLCEVSFGMSFSKAVYDMRLNDLKEGVKNRDYFLLSVRNIDTSLTCDDNLYALEVCFRTDRPYSINELLAMSMLYTVDQPAMNRASCIYGQTNIRWYYATLYGVDAFEWAVAQIRQLHQIS